MIPLKHLSYLYSMCRYAVKRKEYQSIHASIAGAWVHSFDTGGGTHENPGLPHIARFMTGDTMIAANFVLFVENMGPDPVRVKHLYII